MNEFVITGVSRVYSEGHCRQLLPVTLDLRLKVIGFSLLLFLNSEWNSR